MKSNKLNGDESVLRIVMTMAEGNHTAMYILMEMMRKSSGISNILLLDSMGIRGLKLCMLCSTCASGNIDRFEEILMMIKTGVFDEQQILSDLDSNNAGPIIDDNIMIEGISTNDAEYDLVGEQWNEYCKANNQKFITKLDYKEDPQKTYQKNR